MTQEIHPHTELGYVKLKVSNLKRSISFYRDVIGFQLLKQDDKTAEFTADGKHPLLVIEEIPNAVVLPERAAAGLYHYAILLPNRKELGLALKNLLRHGIDIGQGDHLVSEALYLSDPDHNGIEIYRDRPREGWKRDDQGNYVMGTEPVDIAGLLEEAGDQEWQGLPPETKIGHVHFHVRDLHQAKEFYHSVLGFGIAGDYRYMSALFVSAGGYHHHIGLNLWAGHQAPFAPPEACGMAYYTVVLPDRAELENILHRLESSGHRPEEKDDAWFVKDPASGVGIRLTMK
ncbi:VOC family protein [Bacillus sonorensis]|uniref:Catechol-2,3-dioxygenase subunit CatE n=2 Tax=Bacillus sonorensis TaxID=119858 RepID=M5NYD3_9BACI|nr:MULTISPECIES: VOC family protein [Bacillus]ASB87607.1 Catechol 2,3-dioxygenase [Bacillus sonorensis]EME72881.1 catechol-2,3-dioxygenase subunit CatE [Bacillus sonorensis L12]MBG9916379.1 glyoxalase [Bacillus sonorensis]MCF7617057.1 VOC family protein [Bacillus sonorensis]MCY7855060.1 VOC family protein [Bacillus sonorensis]